MNRWTKLVIAVSTILIIPACSLPIKAVKVNKWSDPVEGIRYVLKRPSYKVGLRVNIKKTKFFVNPSSARLSKHSVKKDSVEIVNIINKTSNNDWFTGDDDHQEAIYCISSKSSLSVTLRQEMKGTPLIYEARSRGTPPHWFADSEAAITMDDHGILTAIAAGEKDKSLEFIQAVAGLAVSAAVPVAAAPSKESCLLFGDIAFHEYVSEHIRLASQQKSLIDKLHKTLDKLDPNSPEKMKFGLDAATLLRAEIERVKEKLKVVQYNMPQGTFDVKSNSKSLLPSVPAKPWISVQLTAK